MAFVRRQKKPSVRMGIMIRSSLRGCMVSKGELPIFGGLLTCASLFALPRHSNQPPTVVSSPPAPLGPSGPALSRSWYQIYSLRSRLQYLVTVVWRTLAGGTLLIRISTAKRRDALPSSAPSPRWAVAPPKAKSIANRGSILFYSGHFAWWPIRRRQEGKTQPSWREHDICLPLLARPSHGETMSP